MVDSIQTAVRGPQPKNLLGREQRGLVRPKESEPLDEVSLSAQSRQAQNAPTEKEPENNRVIAAERSLKTSADVAQVLRVPHSTAPLALNVSGEASTQATLSQDVNINSSPTPPPETPPVAPPKVTSLSQAGQPVNQSNDLKLQQLQVQATKAYTNSIVVRPPQVDATVSGLNQVQPGVLTTSPEAQGETQAKELEKLQKEADTVLDEARQAKDESLSQAKSKLEDARENKDDQRQGSRNTLTQTEAYKTKQVRAAESLRDKRITAAEEQLGAVEKNREIVVDSAGKERDRTLEAAKSDYEVSRKKLQQLKLAYGGIGKDLSPEQKAALKEAEQEVLTSSNKLDSANKEATANYLSQVREADVRLDEAKIARDKTVSEARTTYDTALQDARVNLAKAKKTLTTQELEVSRTFTQSNDDFQTERIEISKNFSQQQDAHTALTGSFSQKRSEAEQTYRSQATITEASQPKTGDIDLVG